MKKKGQMKIIFTLVVFLILGFLSFVSAQKTEEFDWGAKGTIAENPEEFAKQFNLNEISGNLNEVVYNNFKGSIENKGVSLPLGDLQNANVEALSEGGFRISGKDNMQIQGKTYSNLNWVQFNADGSITLSQKTLFEDDVFGQIEVLRKEVTINYGENLMNINGDAKFSSGNKEVTGNDFSVHAVSKIPDVESVGKGAHFYFNDEDFLSKGKLNVKVSKGDLTNTYIGDNEDTFFWSKGNEIYVDNLNDFGEYTTIGYSTHEIKLKEPDGGMESVSIRNRYVKKDNVKTLVNSKDLAELSKPRGAIDIFDVKVHAGEYSVIDFRDPENIIYDSILLNPEDIKPKVKLIFTDEDQIKRGGVLEVDLSIYKGSAKSNINFNVNPQVLESIKDYYNSDAYKGNSKNDDFMFSLFNQDEFRMDIESSLSTIGKGGRFFIERFSDKDFNEKLRERFIQTAERSGVIGNDLINFKNFISKAEIGDRIVFDGIQNPPAITLIREAKELDKITVNQESVNKIKDYRMGSVLTNEKLKSQLDALAERLLK